MWQFRVPPGTMGQDTLFTRIIYTTCNIYIYIYLTEQGHYIHSETYSTWTGFGHSYFVRHKTLWPQFSAPCHLRRVTNNFSSHWEPKNSVGLKWVGKQTQGVQSRVTLGGKVLRDHRKPSSELIILLFSRSSPSIFTKKSLPEISYTFKSWACLFK